MDFWHVILALKSKSSYEIPMYVEVFPPRLGEGGEGGGVARDTTCSLWYMQRKAGQECGKE